MPSSKNILLAVCFSILLVFPVKAQQDVRDYRLFFNTGSALLPANFKDIIAASRFPGGQESVIGSDRFLLIQFEEIPGQEEKRELQALGVRLSHYIRNYAWFCQIPVGLSPQELRSYRIRSMSAVLTKWKLSRELYEEAYPGHSLHLNDRIKVLVHTCRGLEKNRFAPLLRNLGATEIRLYPGLRPIELSITIDRIEELAQIPGIYYVEAIDPPIQLEVDQDRATHRANVIASDFATGLHYDGSDVVAAVCEGLVDTTLIDFHGRINGSYHSPASFAGHATGVCQRLGGAGNYDPLDKGMAFGAGLLSVDFGVWNNNSLYYSENMRVANHSYGYGCSGGYNGASVTIDNQVRTFEHLMHVFSCGNIGADSTCDYYGAPGWANITGAVKQSKNVIASGAVNIYDEKMAFSSKGPAYDGRIKPDICAVGPGGTSFASPGIAGAYTQLMHVFKGLNGGQEAEGGMLKAILQNTADDLGVSGPDFKFGFGRINVRRGYELIAGNQWLIDSVANGNVRSHNLIVPQNTAQLRLMLYWTDYEASAGATRALVNDLDLKLISPGQQVFLPWVPDHQPANLSLEAPATRGRDSLNNMEQITVDNPAPGSYSIDVSGFLVPQGPQKYYIIYELLENELHLTFPRGGESLVPGENAVVHWDSYGDTASFQLDFSADSGYTWTTLANMLPPDSRYFDWNVPDTLSGHCFLKISRANLADQSIVPFSIIKVPENIGIGWSCGDSALFFWDSVPGATAYEVSRLGNRYMNAIGVTSKTKFVINGLSANADEWFSVKALGPKDAEGRRAIAYRKVAGDTNCTPTDVAIVLAISPSPGYYPACAMNSPIDLRIEVLNQGISPLSSIPLYYQLDSGIIQSDTFSGPLASFGSEIFSFTDSLDIQDTGFHNLLIWSDMPGDTNAANDTLQIILEVYPSFFAPIPYTQDFDTFPVCSSSWGCESISCNLVAAWFNNPNIPDQLGDSIDFRTHTGETGTVATGPSGDHTSGNGNYLYLETSGNSGSGCRNKQALLYSPCFDLSATHQPTLTFWYHMFGNTIGSLHVDVLSEGMWHTDVMPPIIGPQGDQWYEATVNLSPFVGNDVVLRFRGSTGNGYTGDLAIDDITVFSFPKSGFTADYVNICAGDTVQLTDHSTFTEERLWQISPASYDFIGGTNDTSIHPRVIFYDEEKYSVTLITTNGFGSDTLQRFELIDAGPHSITLTSNPPVSFICSGDSIVATAVAPAASLFTFKVDGNIVQQGTLAHYQTDSLQDMQVLSVEGLVGKDCIISDTLDVFSVLNPTIGGIEVDSSNCPVFQFYGLNTGGNTDYWLWDFGDGQGSDTAQNPAYSYAASGNRNYQVMLITGNVCGQDTATSLVIVDCIPVPDSSGTRISLFPNPGSGEFTLLIRLPDPESVSWRLVDLQGRQVSKSGELEHPGGEMHISIDISGLSSGYYFLGLEISGKRQGWIPVIME